MMTRKYFKMLAEALLMIEDTEKRRLLAEHHAVICAKDNPRFDRAKFYAACKVNFLS